VPTPSAVLAVGVSVTGGVIGVAIVKPLNMYCLIIC